MSKEDSKVKDVKIWMLINDIRPIDIAKEFGVSPPFVTHFISGKRTSSGMVDHLINKGCPASYFRNGRIAA